MQLMLFVPCMCGGDGSGSDMALAVVGAVVNTGLVWHAVSLFRFM